jgi:hypothetical protein
MDRWYKMERLSPNVMKFTCGKPLQYLFDFLYKGGTLVVADELGNEITLTHARSIPILPTREN